MKIITDKLYELQDKEYQVLINVDNIDYYKSLNKEWLQHFEFF